MRALIPASACSLCLTFFAPVAAAAPTEEPPPSAIEAAAESAETVQAREAFRLGSALARQGQWSEALAAFRRSAELRPHPVTTYDIGYCQRALGRPASAYESFSAALKEGDGGALPADIAAEARAFVLEAEARIVRVEVSLPGPGLALRVDGAPIGPLHGDEQATVFLVREQGRPPVSLPAIVELWLDPGPHAFVLTQASGARTVETRQFSPGARDAIRFEAAVPRETSPVSSPRPAAVIPRSDRTAAWISFGVAAAGLGTSAVFAALSLGDRDTLTSDPACADRRCPDEARYRDLQERMLQRADIATGALAVGAVSAVLGGYFWVTAKPAAVEAASGVRPYLGLGSAGVTGRF